MLRCMVAIAWLLMLYCSRTNGLELEGVVSVSFYASSSFPVDRADTLLPVVLLTALDRASESVLEPTWCLGISQRLKLS